MQWMDGAAFGGAVASDMLTTGVLLFVLKSSRTGFKTYLVPMHPLIRRADSLFRRTDRLIDRLTLYAVNTGELPRTVLILHTRQLICVYQDS